MASMAKRKRDLNDQPPPNPGPNNEFADLLRGAGDGGGDLDLAHALQQHNTHGLPGTAGGGAGDDAAADAFDMGDAGSGEQHFDLAGLDYNESPSSAPVSGQLDAQDGGTGTVTRSAQAAGPDNNDPALTAGEGGKQDSAAASADAADPNNPDATSSSAAPPATPGDRGRRASKAKVGTDEWHASRRLAHKDVERRRREMINDGITELAKMVPGAERNKGSILQRAVAYIAELRDRSANLEEKSGLAKMMFEQTVGELNATTDRLAAEVRRLEAENDRLRKGAK